MLLLMVVLAACEPPEGQPWLWAPPTTTTVRDYSAAGDVRIKVDLAPGEDARIILPTVEFQSLEINGGRNVVIDGGRIEQDTYRRAAVEIKDWAGELWVHDLHVNPSGPSNTIEADAIRVNSRHAGSIATLQQIRVDEVQGAPGDGRDHGDVIQTWGGPSSLRVWRLTGHTDYQGFYFAPVHLDWHPPMGDWVIIDVDLHGIGNDGNTLLTLSGQSDQGDGDFFAPANGAGRLGCIAVTTEHPPSGWDLTQGSFAECGATEGVPPTGEWVPADG